jgi:hypothetical protein
LTTGRQLGDGAKQALEFGIARQSGERIARKSQFGGNRRPFGFRKQALHTSQHLALFDLDVREELRDPSVTLPAQDYQLVRRAEFGSIDLMFEFQPLGFRECAMAGSVSSNSGAMPACKSPSATAGSSANLNNARSSRLIMPCRARASKLMISFQ